MFTIAPFTVALYRATRHPTGVCGQSQVSTTLSTVPSSRATGATFPAPVARSTRHQGKDGEGKNSMIEIHAHKDDFETQVLKATADAGFAKWIAVQSQRSRMIRVAGDIGPWRYKFMTGAYRAYLNALPAMEYEFDDSPQDNARMEADQKAAWAAVPAGAEDWVTLYATRDEDWEDDEDFPFSWEDKLTDLMTEQSMESVS